MKKRDLFWIVRFFNFLIIILVFFGISFFGLVQFNSSYMEEEQEELEVFKKQVEWGIIPYLEKKDFKTVQKYSEEFMDEDMTIRIFDKNKKLLVTSDLNNKKDLLPKNAEIFNKHKHDWKNYTHSIKNKKIGLIDELNINNEKYYIEITISEVDVMKTILIVQRNLMFCVVICMSILSIGLLQFFYHLRTSFNKFEYSVLEIAKGNLDTEIETPKLELLSEFAQSVKKMVIRLKMQIERLKQLEKYKSSFMQNVTHEIKTPITAINSAIELIKDNNSITKADEECFDIIQTQVQNITKLVEDVLCLSELEVLKTDETKEFKNFNLNKTIKNVIEKFSLIAYTTKQKINFIANDDIEYYGSEELMEIALSNLLSNAIRYSNSTKIEVILNKEENNIELTVRDYGVGIEAKYLNHIFEKFYRIDKLASRQKGGSGLGLAIVKNIIELHGGKIRVESDSATSFIITL